MPRTQHFDALVRLLQQADAVDRTSGAALPSSGRGVIGRRQFLAGTARGAAAAAMAAGLPVPSWGARATVPDVGIVGGGLAGLACADTLRQRGVVAAVYEASSRAGGRCWSLRQTFPGQVVERGGELIDNLTTIAGHEGTSVGNVHFAGEHANSFYEWQGFMEGAALSGIDVAERILKGA
jgi:monoamine oxidase